jgi:HEPN domain-containing protein
LDHLEQAGLWLEAAKHVFELPAETRNKYTVASALAIHAAIKANDALTTRFLGRVPRRHEEAPALFLELIKRNHIPAEEARHRDVLSEAVSRKSAANYYAEFFSKRDAGDLLKKVGEFIRMARRHCGAG